MAILNLDYYGSKDLYSDGDIENKMLQIAKAHQPFEELVKEEQEFPIIYHFSDIRENIINWYPFIEDASVLEIGAGCGAITGVLCQKAKKVVSVELSKRRADINYERNKDKENLTIMVGNLNDMEFSEAFDYVVVNGVLEYAIGFTEGDTPYETFLKNMGSYLKPDGRILIAIENRLGMKYFAGAPEDHTDLHFFGIEEYPNNQSVRTFSKVELNEILERSGFPHYKYYYPYPDYKFPTEIFTDEALREGMFGKAYPVYTENYVKLFDEQVASKGLLKEQIMDRFMNSFFVVASRERIREEKKFIYIKLNQDRKEAFRLRTEIVEADGVRYVEKYPMNPKAEAFAGEYYKKGLEHISGSYKNLPCEPVDGGLRYPFLSGVTLHEQIAHWVEEGELAKIQAALTAFYQECFENRKPEPDYQGEAFCEVFGTYPGKAHYECIAPANIDLICANIFESKDQKKIIDYEWVFDFPVPVQFVMWRMIHELYGRIPQLSGLCLEFDMLKLFDIDYSDYEIFMHWTNHFVYEYVGCGMLTRHQKDKVQVSLPELVQEDLAKRRMMTKLYYAQGGQLSEECTITKSILLNDGRFVLEFDLSDMENITSLRWHPSLGRFCKVTIEDVECGQRANMIQGNMHIKLDDATTLFLSTDAYYYIVPWDASAVKHITIRGKIAYPEEKELEQLLNEYKMCQDRSRQVQAESSHITGASADAADAGNGQKTLESCDAETASEEKGTMKRKVKQIIKKILRYENASDTTYGISSCVGCVDVFSSEDNMVRAVGWVFDKKYPMEQPHIAFYDKQTKLLEEAYTVIYRKDVAEAYQNPSAEVGGFAYTSVVLSPVDLDVYFEYHTPDGVGRMKLGVLKAAEHQERLEVYSLEAPEELGNLQHFERKHLIAQGIDYQSAIGGTMIDVIIPVYNGLKYFDALFSSVKKTNMPYRLLVVDDCSPDEEVRAYLDALKEKDEHVVLLRNENNLGFVKSVNRALEMAEHPVALVNTDVELPDEWLERLMYPILTMPKVATSTPFTTCGTICSFPNFCEDNVIFENMPLWRIDHVFRSIQPSYPVMPTGVGFCMGMSLEAIREIGALDAQTFGKGYGEENDWCQRAVKAGYKNVQVDNLFVYHKHGGSFPSVEKQNLIKRNSELLLKKHPEYNNDVAQFCRKDPMRTVRLYAKKELLDMLWDVKVILAFDHSLGGGATEYLNEKRRLALVDGNRFITVRYDFHHNRYCVEDEYKDYVIKYFANDLTYVLDQMKHINEIWINELVTYPDLYQVLDEILRVKEKHQAHLKTLLHDYFPLCPAINLMDENGQYCHAAKTERCNTCIPANKSNACITYESGNAWRAHWKEFLMQCDELVAFSDDTVHLYRSIYPELYKIRVIPHTPHYMIPLKKTFKTTKTLNIGLLGVLGYKKGAEIIKEMLEIIEKQYPDMQIKLIGVPEDEMQSPHFSYTGRYAKEQLPKLTLQQDIDLFFVSSICPETYSYTASEIMSMDMPIAVFPIGAPVERVKHYERGLVLSDVSAKTAVEEIRAFAKEKLHWEEFPVCETRILFVAEENSFASRYRVEHFQEQLAYKGIPSDFIQMDEMEKVTDWQLYHSVVLYRCKQTERVKKICAAAKAHGLLVYYDIDDLIFDYNKIAYLDFLKDEEYKTFRSVTEQTFQCMTLCDGFVTSTNTLAKEIKTAFPDKPVVINRNCASMEMQILSHDAVAATNLTEDKIYIGYFSGSKTHNKDFAIVEEVLEEVMAEYPNVMLKLVGVISSELEERLQNRIITLPFMEWQKLPSALAATHINLMPLEDSLFHCCKSENKWTEAAFVKVPSVMSRNAEMEAVIESGVTGMLCETKEEWKHALVSLIESKQLRTQIAENANRKVLEHYTTQNTGVQAMEFVTK